MKMINDPLMKTINHPLLINGPYGQFGTIQHPRPGQPSLEDLFVVHCLLKENGRLEEQLEADMKSGDHRDKAMLVMLTRFTVAFSGTKNEN